MNEVKEFIEWLTKRSDIEYVQSNGFFSTNGEFYTNEKVLEEFKLYLKHIQNTLHD